MSDSRPRRTARESGHSNTPAVEAPPPMTSPVVPETARVVPEASIPQAASVAEAVAAPAEAPAKLAPSAVALEVDKLADSPVDSWAAVAEAQAAFARGFEEIAVEMTGMTQAGLRAATDAAISLVGARTFSEAVEINARLARRGVDTMIEGSVKLSEIGVRAVGDASRPMVSQIGVTWTAIRQNAAAR